MPIAPRPSMPSLRRFRIVPHRVGLALAIGLSAGLAPPLVRPANAQLPADEQGPPDGPGAYVRVHPDPIPESERRVSEYVREVFEDRDGTLWFGTNGDGIVRLDGDQLTYLSWDEGFDGSAVRGIAQSADGAMWFATDAGVTRMVDDGFTNWKPRDGLLAPSVWSLHIDRGGTVWAGTHAGLCRFDGQTWEAFPLPRVAVDEPSSRFSPVVVFAIEEDARGALWFGTDGEGVHRWDGRAFTSFTARDGLGSNLVRSVREDSRGRIWVGSDGGGVSRWDGETWRTFTSADGLNNDRVFEIVEDRHGHMWFSTLGAGACRWDGASFAPFGVEQGLSINELPCPCGSGRPMGTCHGPGGGHVQEILEDRAGRLWFGCSGGLFRLEDGRFVHVTRGGPWPETGDPSTGNGTAGRATGGGDAAVDEPADVAESGGSSSS